MSDRSIQKFKEYVQKLNPIDDIIFRKMAENKEFCEEILRTFLQDYQLKVLNNKSQYAITNIERRSVILDAYCELRDGRRVNIEVQNADNVNHQKRVRYYSSVLTTSLMKKGESFDNVPEVCMIYICNFDIFKENKSSYLIKRVIAGSNTEVDNGLKEIYISANINDGTILSELMGVFTKDDCYSDNFPVTSKMKYDFKYVKEGNKMTDAMKELYDIFKEESKDKWIKEGKKEGRKEGIKEGVINTLLMLVKDGIISVEDAAKRANLSVSTFQNPDAGVHWTVGRKYWQIIRDNWPAYDKKLTPTNTMGAVAEMFRLWEGTVRSDHPARSVAAWGKNALYLTKNHDLSDILGKASPVGRLYELDGKVLLIGVGYDKNTSLHLADTVANYGGKHNVTEHSAVMEEGKRVWKAYETLYVNGEDFNEIGEAFERERDVKKVKLGNCEIRLMRQRDLVDFAKKWIEENRR